LICINDNKAFKDENLGNVLQSGIKIYTNMDKDVQKTLQNDVDRCTNLLVFILVEATIINIIL
jgi:membrane peptidoglycan carboxypeptidase